VEERPFSRWRQPLLLDLLVVAGLTAVTLWHVWVRADVAAPLWLRLVWPLFLDLPLLWRRRLPLVSLAVISAAIVLQALFGSEAAQGFELVGPVAVAVFSTAAYGTRGEALLGLALLLAAGGVHDARSHGIGTAAQLWADAFWWLVQLAIWLAGRFVRGRRERTLLVGRAELLEREAGAAAEQERARIARELHDIVSHNLSVVVTQAAGARALAEHGGAAPESLERIEESGREALVEMRRLLGVLREGGGTALAPQPGVAQLPALAETLRAAGLEVDLHLAESCCGLPPALDLSVYRIVQEALTNVLKHAAASRATVTLERTPESLTVEVGDDGAARAIATVRGGQGLVGMRERVSLFGGSLAAGPRPGGGFLVRAQLPLASP
jgi:signal transduction histidine kinase